MRHGPRPIKLIVCDWHGFEAGTCARPESQTGSSPVDADAVAFHSDLERVQVVVDKRAAVPTVGERIELGRRGRWCALVRARLDAHLIGGRLALRNTALTGRAGCGRLGGSGRL